MRKTIYSFVAIAAILSSCSSEPLTVKEGESFKMDGQNLTINVASSPIMTNHDEKSTIIAPEGQTYLKVNITAENDSYFLSVKDDETKLTEVDYLIARNFVDKSDKIVDPNKCNLYLVDKSNANYKIQLESYGDESATVAVGQLDGETSESINPSMLNFIAEFQSGKRLSEIVKKYIPEGADHYNYMTEKGTDVASDPIVKGLTISYVPDNNTFHCRSEFGVSEVIISWSGKLLEKVTFDL